MSDLMRNIIIVGVAVVIFLAVVVIIEIRPTGPAIFKRCDGRSDPVEDIWISSCPDANKLGYCEIERNHTTHLKMTFTPRKSR